MPLQLKCCAFVCPMPPAGRPNASLTDLQISYTKILTPPHCPHSRSIYFFFFFRNPRDLSSSEIPMICPAPCPLTSALFSLFDHPPHHPLRCCAPPWRRRGCCGALCGCETGAQSPTSLFSCFGLFSPIFPFIRGIFSAWALFVLLRRLRVPVVLLPAGGFAPSPGVLDERPADHARGVGARYTPGVGRLHAFLERSPEPPRRVAKILHQPKIVCSRPRQPSRPRATAAN